MPALGWLGAGESGRFNHLLSECTATAGFGEGLGSAIAGGGVQRTGSYTVVVSANAGRIAWLASAMKKRYQPLAVGDVPEELRTPGIIIAIEPQAPSRSGGVLTVASAIEHVVLKSKIRRDVVAQPIRVEKETVEWSNLLGGKIEAHRAVAFFEDAAVRELPPGEFDVVIIAPEGERRCKVGRNDRVKLFPNASRFQGSSP